MQNADEGQAPPRDFRRARREGLQAHQAIQADWVNDAKAEGKPIPERHVIKHNKRTGRIDLYIEVDDQSAAIIEIKDTDWEAKQPHRVRPSVLSHIRQIYGYMNAELRGQRGQRDAASQNTVWNPLWDQLAIYPALIYTRRPRNPARLAEIEAICAERLVSVVWEDESVQERRARAMPAIADSEPGAADG